MYCKLKFVCGQGTLRKMLTRIKSIFQVVNNMVVKERSVFDKNLPHLFNEGQSAS